jgi:hypothetical protein
LNHELKTAAKTSPSTLFTVNTADKSNSDESSFVANSCEPAADKNSFVANSCEPAAAAANKLLPVVAIKLILSQAIRSLFAVISKVLLALGLINLDSENSTKNFADRHQQGINFLKCFCLKNWPINYTFRLNALLVLVQHS